MEHSLAKFGFLNVSDIVLVKAVVSPLILNPVVQQNCCSASTGILDVWHTLALARHNPAVDAFADVDANMYFCTDVSWYNWANQRRVSLGLVIVVLAKVSYENIPSLNQATYRLIYVGNFSKPWFAISTNC